MIHYRVVPGEPGGWTVQYKRRKFSFWRNVRCYHEYGKCFVVREFSTKKEAIEWIERALE